MRINRERLSENAQNLRLATREAESVFLSPALIQQVGANILTFNAEALLLTNRSSQPHLADVTNQHLEAIQQATTGDYRGIKESFKTETEPYTGIWAEGFNNFSWDGKAISASDKLLTKLMDQMTDEGHPYELPKDTPITLGIIQRMGGE